MINVHCRSPGHFDLCSSQAFFLRLGWCARLEKLVLSGGTRDFSKDFLGEHADHSAIAYHRRSVRQGERKPGNPIIYKRIMWRCISRWTVPQKHPKLIKTRHDIRFAGTRTSIKFPQPISSNGWWFSSQLAIIPMITP